VTNQHGTLNVVVSRDRSANAGRTTLENAVAALFAERAGATVLVVPHLYHVPEDDPVWKKLAGLTGRVVFLSWLYPRPAEWLLRRHGVGAEGLLALHMGAYETAEQCFEAAAANLAAAPGTVTELSGKPSKRWYPVLDYSRCAKCRQCLQFCLFGVYAADEGGKVRVAKPENCKTGCPACARICPHAAIIFPKYAEGPISGDDAPPPAAEEGRPEKPIDFSSLAGLDIHEAIRRRSTILRAHQEREQAKARMKNPPEEGAPRDE